VIGVGVGVDDRDDRALFDLLVDELQCRGRGFLGGQRIEYDPARIALDEADVREVVAAP